MVCVSTSIIEPVGQRPTISLRMSPAQFPITYLQLLLFANALKRWYIDLSTRVLHTRSLVGETAYPAKLKASLATNRMTKESEMSLSTRFTGERITFRKTVLALMVIAMALFPLGVSAEEEPCREMGMAVGNQTTRGLWYTRNGGPCTLWARGHLLMIKPDDTLILYKDMTCSTAYCPSNLTYDLFKSLDIDQNCRVRILPNCTLSDM